MTRDRTLSHSAGTELTHRLAWEFHRPILLLDLTQDHTTTSLQAWLLGLPHPFILNIGGPRESESPGIYTLAQKFLLNALPKPSLTIEE